MPAHRAVARREHADVLEVRRPGAMATALVIAPGMLLATVLTALNYSSKPLWRDEWYTLSTADRPLLGMLEIIKGPDVGLAGFYSAMHLWLSLGDAIWWLRLPSALATVALSVVAALLARRLAGAPAGFLAGLLVAALPPVFTHAQEARAYPLVLLTTTLTALLVLRYRDSPTPQRGWWLAAAAVTPGCLHPIVGLPAVAGLFLGAVLAPGRARRSRLVALSAPAAVGGLLLIAAGFRQQREGSTPEPAALADLARLPLTLAGPVWLALLLWGSAVAGLVFLAHQGAPARDGRSWLVLTCWLAAPLVVVSGMGLAGSYFRDRYVSDAAPALAVLVACALAHLLSAGPSRLRVVAVVAVTAAVLVPGIVTAVDFRSQSYDADDPRSAAASLALAARPGDAVVYVGTTARGLTTYYLRKEAPGEDVPDDVLMSATPLESQSLTGREVPADERTKTLSEHQRVWVVGATVSGKIPDPEKVADVTQGRRMVRQEDHGGFRTQLWMLPRSP